MARLPRGIDKMKDGRFRYRFTFEGKRKAVYGATKKEAEEKGRKALNALENGAYIHNDAITLKDYAVKWIERRREKGKVTEKTLYCYKSELENHVLPIAGKKKVQKIERREIEEVLNEIKDTAGAYTANYCKQVLFCLFRWAKRDGIRSDNPCEDMESFGDNRKGKNTKKKEHRALTDEEIHTFFSAARNSTYYYFFRFLLATGLRVGEAAALRRGDIDFLKGFIHVERTITGDINGHPVMGETAKTENSIRTIQMNTETGNLLNEYIAFQYGLSGRVMVADELLFKNTRGEFITGGAANVVLRNIIRKIQRNGREFEPFAVHAFRHTFASMAIRGGMGSNTLKEIMGHSSIVTTLNIYAHEYDETKRAAMEKIVTFKEGKEKENESEKVCERD